MYVEVHIRLVLSSVVNCTLFEYELNIFSPFLSCNFSETARRLKERYPMPPSSADSHLAAPPTSGCGNKDHPQWKAKPTYDDLRAEAALQAKLRAECFQKAAKAHSQKKMELAQYYAQSVSGCCIVLFLVIKCCFLRSSFYAIKILSWFIEIMCIYLF